MSWNQHFFHTLYFYGSDLIIASLHKNWQDRKSCNVVLCWSYYGIHYNAYPIVYFSEERIRSKVFFDWNFQVVLLKQGEKFYFSALIVISQTITHFSTHIFTLYWNYFENRQKMRQWSTPISSRVDDNILSFHGLNIISNVMVQMKEQS